MDDILAKHLTSTLLLLKNEEIIKTTVDESVIPYYSYKVIDNLFHVITDGSTIVSERIGYWKDKPVLTYNNNKYVLLESSHNIIKIDNLGITPESITNFIVDTKIKEEQISNNLLKSIKNIINTSAPSVKQKEIIDTRNKEEEISNNLLKSIRDIITTSTPNTNPRNKSNTKSNKIVKKDAPVVPKEVKTVVQNAPVSDITPTIEIIDKKVEGPVDSTTPVVAPDYLDLLKKSEINTDANKDSNNPTVSYVDTLKDTETGATGIDKTPSSTIDEEAIISLLDKNRDDPRIKRLFSYHSDAARKELFEIADKFSRENKENNLKMAHLFESGGGTNAVQYANGGTMDGDLSITGNLQVTGTIVGGNSNLTRKVFLIGNGVDLDYTVTHALNTRNIIVNLYNQNNENIISTITNISDNETTVSFNEPMDTDSIKVVIIG